MGIRKKIAFLFKGELIKHTAVVFAGASVAGFFCLLYHLVCVRVLKTQDYGTFNSLISFIMFVSMTVFPFAAALTRFFTEYIAQKDIPRLLSTFKKIIKRLSVSALVLLFLFSALSPLISGFLKTKTLYIIICAGIVSLSLFCLPFPCLFQSFQKFKTFSFLGVISSLGKLSLGVYLMYLGWGIYGALSGFLAAPLLVFLISLFFIPAVFKRNLSSSVRNGSIEVNLVPIYKYFFPVAIVMLSFTLLTNIDVVLVKHFFSPVYAGDYSIAQIVGKIFLFLPSALAIVIFPKSTKAYVTNVNSHKILYKSLALAVIICAGGVGLCILKPGFVLNILTSKVNPASNSLVGLFSLAMSFYAFTWITVSYLLATHNLKFILPFAACAVLETVFIYLNHISLNIILSIVLAFSIISFLTVLCGVWFSRPVKSSTSPKESF